MPNYDLDLEIEEGLKRSEEMLRKQKAQKITLAAVGITIGLALLVIVGFTAYSLGKHANSTAISNPSLTSAESANLPSATFTLLPTETLLPALTATSTVKGPVKFYDSFSNLNNWQNCDTCAIKDGALIMGPYPAVDSAKAYPAVCIPCGDVTYYKMSVDAWYEAGASDRGFGFLIRMLSDGSFTDLEINTWQDYGIWYYDPAFGDKWRAWTSPAGGWLTGGYVRAGRLPNHVEVQVSKIDEKNDLLTIRINDHKVREVYLLHGKGKVGLIVGLHSLAVAFDNFHFEENGR